MYMIIIGNIQIEVNPHPSRKCYSVLNQLYALSSKMHYQPATKGQFIIAQTGRVTESELIGWVVFLTPYTI